VKLNSCDNCGVVLDEDKLPFPSDIYNEEGVDDSKGAYNQKAKCFEVYVPCPVCKAQVFQS